MVLAAVESKAGYTVSAAVFTATSKASSTAC